MGAYGIRVLDKEGREALPRRSKVGVCFYSTEEVSQMLQIGPRQLRYWLEMGVIRPDIAAGGKGTRRFFSRRNLLQVAICDDLSRSGMSFEHIKGALDSLRARQYFDRLGQQNREAEPIALLVLDHHSVEVRKEVRLEELSNGHRSLTFINLPRIERCVAEAIATKSGDD